MGQLRSVHHKCIYFPPKTKANHNFTPPIFITAGKTLMRGGLSAALSWFEGALVLASNGGKVSAWMGCSWVLYSTSWANCTTLQQATTQNSITHTTATRAAAALSTSSFGPCSPWAEHSCPQIIAPLLPHECAQVVSHRACACQHHLMFGVPN